MPKRVHDGGLKKRCKCSSRRWAKCPHPWWFSFYCAKRPNAEGRCEYRLSLDVIARQRGESPPVGTTEAKAWCDKLRGEIRNGIDPSAPPAPASSTLPDTDQTHLTVGDVMDKYLTQHVQAAGRKPAGQVVMTAYIKRLRAMKLPAAHGTSLALEDKTLDSVTAADLDVLRRGWTLEKTAAQGGRTGPNRALKRLRHFFNWAIELGHTEHSPFKRAHVNTIHFSKESGRTRRLEGDEETRLMKQATTPLLKVLITTALDTGCRIGELLQLTWADVKWDQNVLLLPVAITKTNEARVVPLTQRLRALLDLRRHAPDGTEHAADRFVFGNEVGEPIKYWRVNQAWHDTCEAAGIAGLHLHDLRRQFASTLSESGAPLFAVSAVLGHADISTTSRYLKTTDAGLGSHIERLEQHRIEQAAAKEKAAKRKSRKIRTPFAHDAFHGRSGDSKSALGNRAKSLN